jgi:hypothetical protein
MGIIEITITRVCSLQYYPCKGQSQRCAAYNIDYLCKGQSQRCAAYNIDYLGLWKYREGI